MIPSNLKPSTTQRTWVLLVHIALSVLLLPLSGCMIFLPINDPITEDNAAPQIVYTGISPEPFFSLSLSDPNSANFNISVPRVLDLNENDTLYAYIFANRNKSPRGSFRCNGEVPPASEDFRKSEDYVPGLRETPIFCPITVSQPAFVAGTETVIELFVGDRRPQIDQPFDLETGEMNWPAGTRWVRYVWTVSVRD